MVFMFVFPFLPHCVAYRILVPSPGIEPGPPQWKHQVPTPGPPGNSPIFMFDQYQHQLTQKSPVLVLSPHLHGGDLPCPLPAGQGGGRWWELVKEKGKTGGEGAKWRLGPREALLTSSSFCHNFYFLLPFALGNRPAVGRSLFTSCLCCRPMVGKLMLRRLCEQKYCLWGLAAKAATTVLIPLEKETPPNLSPSQGKSFFFFFNNFTDAWKCLREVGKCCSGCGHNWGRRGGPQVLGNLPRSVQSRPRTCWSPGLNLQTPVRSQVNFLERTVHEWIDLLTVNSMGLNYGMGKCWTFS